MAPSNSKKSANLLLAIFIILTLLLCIGGNVLYRYQKKNITIEKHAELSAISKLKVDQIVNWRRERLVNARSIYNNQAIITHISEYIHGENYYANYRIITKWMNSILEEPDYSMVALIDTKGKIIINTNPVKPIAESGKRIIERAQMSKNIVFSDLIKYNDKDIFIDLVIPLYLNPDKHEGFSGVVFIRIDPEKFLYPMVLNWPTPSRTSEILLVRKDGDSVLFLSELQHKKNTAFSMRRPMTDTHILSVKAVAGIIGILEGDDYRGIKVLGDTHPVPGSAWFIITKVDIDEIYHPIATLAIWIFVITFLLILISALIIFVVWSQQLRKSERERKALLQHFEYVVKYANDIICLADLKGNIYEVNDKAVNTYGYTYNELLNLHLSQLRPVETQDTLNQQLKLLNEKDGRIYETIHHRKNGKKFPVEVSGRIMVIMGVQYIQFIIRDITERNLAVEKLRESEKGFRTLAESIPQFVWIARADAMISYFNQQWVEYTGLSLEESYGTGWNIPFHPDDKQIAWDAWKLAIETGKNYDLECRLRQYDGVYHWFVIRGVPLRDSVGEIIKWYGTCTDIDNQKQAEKESKKLNEELEQRVDERTFQLQTANKELEAFSYSVSHDLRAPLHNIDGWSSVLLEHCHEQIDEKGRQYLDIVRKETQHMGHLIDALLKLSRVGRTELKKVHLDLSILAQDIVERLLKEPTDRLVEFSIQPGMVTFGDQDLLDIVLTNLLNNAYKFTGKQSLAFIEFGQSVIDEKQTFWVRDNGAGFDMANAKNLFGAFQRMHKQSDFPGTGIGLATVQRIIHRHDGNIRAESKINEGTTFYFTIPEDIG